MTDKEKILAKIESLLNETNYEPFTDEVLGKIQTLNELKSYIDSLQEEPASEELEEEIKRYIHEVYDRDTTVSDVARHFANRQKEMMMSKAINGEWFRCGIVLPSKYYADDVKKVKITIWQDGV